MQSIQAIIKHVDGFTVTGLAVRTQNSDEFNEKTAKLPQLWQQFYSSNLATGTSVFGVYSDYESNENAPYTVTVGVTCENQDPDFSTVKISSGNYLVFRGVGTMPLAVIETWGRVWDYFTTENLYQRCFISDFEAYNGGDEVAIYIGIK
ncbi:MAG: GyrI-like domain-containing protein [Legionellales bacterium]